MTEKKNSAPRVYAAMCGVMKELGAGIAKGNRNQQQGYNFRGIDDVYNALSGPLSRNGLVMLPRVTERTCEERKTQRGGALYNVVVRVEFELVCAEDGSSVSITTYGEAMDTADKATNKAMAAAYKYASFMAFCIPTEGDNDADSSTPEATIPKSSHRRGPHPVRPEAIGMKVKREPVEKSPNDLARERLAPALALCKELGYQGGDAWTAICDMFPFHEIGPTPERASDILDEHMPKLLEALQSEVELRKGGAS